MKLTDHSVHLVHKACRFLSSRGLETRVRHKLSRVALGTRMIIFSPSCQLLNYSENLKIMSIFLGIHEGIINENFIHEEVFSYTANGRYRLSSTYIISIPN